MEEEEIEEMFGHYLDNVESAVDVAMGHLDNQDLSDEDREKAIALLKSRIEDTI